MKVLLHTNVWIAGLIARGQCAELIEHCIGEHELVVSEWILDEVRQVLARKFGHSDDLVLRTESWVREVAGVAFLTGEPPEVCRDPDDNWVLLTATEADADVIVSGDSDLLDVGSHREIPIIGPADFWRFERTGERPS